MKKLILLSSALAAAWAFSCSNESEEELFSQPVCEETVSLSADIMPLLQSNCAVESCHIQGNGLPDFRLKEKVLVNAGEIRRLVGAGIMPPATSGRMLTRAEIDRISCWVQQGKQDN